MPVETTKDETAHHKARDRRLSDTPQDRPASHYEADKGHGRIEERTVAVSAETDWLTGERHFSGEFRLPDAACVLRVTARTHLKDHCRSDTRYYNSSRRLIPEDAAHAVRGHWAIQNSPHWTLDTVFHDDLRRNRKGHGAIKKAIVCHCAVNLVRAIADQRSLKNRQKRAGWDTKYLTDILGALPCLPGFGALKMKSVPDQGRAAQSFPAHGRIDPCFLNRFS